MTNYRHWALWNIKAFPFPEHLYGLATMDHFSCRLGWNYMAANTSCDHRAAQYKMGKQHPSPWNFCPEEEVVCLCRYHTMVSDGSSIRKGFSHPSPHSPPPHFTVRLSWDLITFCVKYKLIDSCNTHNDQENSDLKILCSSSRLRH